MKDMLTIVQEECTRLLLRCRDLEANQGIAGAMAQVRAFHEQFGVPVLESPWLPGIDRSELRQELIAEEAAETAFAIETGNLAEIADGLADLIYVCLGTALEFGIPLHEIFNEVHRSNMRKVGGATREDGKILKPDGWEPPDIERILESSGKK